MVYPSTLNPTAINTALISLKNIDWVYSGDGDASFHALHNIDLDLNNGDFVCAIGLSFCSPYSLNSTFSKHGRNKRSHCRVCICRGRLIEQLPYQLEFRQFSWWRLHSMQRLSEFQSNAIFCKDRDSIRGGKA